MNHLTLPLELKSLTEEGRFAGYAALFGVVDSQQDVIERGAFVASLAERGAEGIKLLWQHHMDEPIGQIEAMFEDEQGLYMEAKLMMSLQRGREAYDLIQSKTLQGLSIGYRPVQYRIDPETGVRYLQKVDLFEVSLVTFPANEAAGITVVKSASNIVPSHLVKLSDALSGALDVLKMKN